MRLSSTKVWASSVPASLNRKKMSGKPPFFSASLQIFIEAIADNGVLGEGFQMQMSPQAAATKAFQAQTATGKLNAEMIPTRPIGRSEEHTSELQSLMRISYAVFCLKKKTTQT